MVKLKNETPKVKTAIEHYSEIFGEATSEVEEGIKISGDEVLNAESIEGL